ncbi:TetR/AcrR family transcriptional regulator [Engelhardtia mirabilis]
MPRPRLDDSDLLTALEGIFRTHGFEGASVGRLVEATGLQRASLYHRFPGGKAQMATAVLTALHQGLVAQILAPLSGDGDLTSRVRAVAGRIDAFYAGGQRPCAIDTLSLGQPTQEVAAAIADTVETLVAGLAGAAREAGATPAAARRRAEEAFVRVEGALVLARASGETRAFKRVIKGLPALLVEGRVEL